MHNGIIHTAIIDDGINEKFYGIGELEYNIEITPELEVRVRSGYDPYSPSHGTTCAAVIRKYSPHTRLSSIKILNERARGMSGQLVKALEWCAENGIKLVNLSLGTVVFSDFPSIKKAVNYACSKGVIIVAACNNKNIYTYPASHSCVIGVKRDMDYMLDEGEIRFTPYPCDGIEVTAFSSHSLTDYRGNTRKKSSSNSFAAPLVTALVNNMLNASPGKSLEEIKLELFKRSGDQKDMSYNPNICKSMDWVNKAVLFCLCLNEYCCCSSIPFSFDVNETIHIHTSRANDGLACIKDYINSNSCHLQSCDTIAVLDHNSSYIYSQDDIKSFFEYSAMQNKNTVLLGECFRRPADFIGYSNKIWTPSLYHLFADESTNNKVSEIPVVLLWDTTGSKLFRLQNSLTEMFRTDGYNALPATCSCIGAAAGFEYLPFESDRPEGIVNGLRRLGSLHNADIIIYSIESSNIENHSVMRELIIPEIDIEITISGFSGSTNEIRVSSVDGGKFKDRQQPGLFNLEDEECTAHLYKHIIALFDQEEAG